MTFAQSERAALCDLFDRLGSQAPTLCEDWDTHDLASHLWIRENDPLGASGISVKPLSGLNERRMAEVRQRWPFPDLVERIRNGPARFSIFAIPGVDEGANTTEFFVHHEDVRRGQTDWRPRDLPPGLQATLWARARAVARFTLRRVPAAVQLRAPGYGEATGPARGEPVRLVGTPGELLLFLTGRQRAARVQVDGPPALAEKLRTARLGL